MDFQVLLKVEGFVIKDLVFLCNSNGILWFKMVFQVKSFPHVLHHKKPFRAPNDLIYSFNGNKHS